MKFQNIKTHLFYSQIKSNGQVRYYYETDGFIFDAEKPRILEEGSERDITNKKVKSNP